MEHIVQMIPAQGWEAVVVIRETGKMEAMPVAAWALTEDFDECYDDGTPIRMVDGLLPAASGEVLLCSDLSNFVGYKTTFDELEMMREEADAQLRLMEKKLN